MEKKTPRSLLKALILSSLMGAIGFVLMLLEFPLAFLIPSFIKLDFSELPALITSFAMGPVFGVTVCLIKNLLHLSVSQTAGVGELANFILGAVFIFSAGWIYKLRKNRKYALLGCAVGAVLTAVISVPVNYFITYPFYTHFMPMDAIIGMYQAILPYSDTLFKCLTIFNLPFTFLKGMLNTALCFMIYKKISPMLK